MNLTQCSIDTTIIGILATDAEQRGLTEQEFKDKFDKFGKDFVKWFNETHLPNVKEQTEAGFTEVNKSLSAVNSTYASTWYVDSANGLDTNDGKTANTAKKTLMAVLNTLPLIINNNITINVASGTLSGDLAIAKLGIGTITISGAGTDKTIFTGNIYGFFIGQINIKDSKINNIDNRIGTIYLNNIISDNTSDFCIIGNSGSVTRINVATISNKSDRAMYAIDGATIITTQVVGIGNNIVHSAEYGGRICKGWGNTITGTTTDSAVYGGQII